MHFTDASGGVNAKSPSLRRVSSSIAVLDSALGDPQLSWGLHSPLPGVIQTVPGGELFAIVRCIMHCASGGVDVVTDSYVNVNVYNSGRTAALLSTNGDLQVAVHTSRGASHSSVASPAIPPTDKHPQRYRCIRSASMTIVADGTCSISNRTATLPLS